MKKTINILLVIFLTVMLTSCFTSQDDVNNAKKELGIIELDKTTDLIDDAKEDLIGSGGVIQEDEIVKKPEIKKVEIRSLTVDQFLELDDLSNENIFDGEVEVTGTTNAKVDSIIVTFVNEDSEFPVDEYKLKQFSAGDDTFLYRAFKKYETLDSGKNVYILEAKSGDKTSKLELTLNVIKEESEEVKSNIIQGNELSVEEKVYEEINISDLPVSASFGTPVDLGNGKISYSDLNGLEIKKDANPNLTCENLTSELAEQLNTWFFWNTCRPVGKDDGITFYVIRLDGGNYVYEKHYYLSYKGLYGIQELENGEGITSQDIGDKNTELKEKNEDYVILKVTDELFKAILN